MAECFYKEVEIADPELGRQYTDYRNGNVLSAVGESNLIVKLAPYLGSFVARLFQIENAAKNERIKAEAVKPIFQFKKKKFHDKTRY